MKMQKLKDHPVFTQEIQQFSSRYSLSQRESDVFKSLITHVTSSKDIAGHLDISANTIRNHFQNIFNKTSTKSKSELLVRFIHDLGRQKSSMSR